MPPWSSTLAADISDSETAVRLTTPLSQTYRFSNLVVIESEILTVDGAGGTVIAVRRGALGTEPVAHAAGAAVTRYGVQTTAGGTAGAHTHPESDVTSLVTDLAGKASSGHNHDASYAPTHSHPYAATSHAHVDADIPAAIARDAEVTSAISTHAATPHGGSLPAGLIVMWGGLLANIPSGWLLCDGQNGTPDLRDRFVKGAAAAANPGATGGSATHGHTVTQPADHAALTHTGTAVGNHTFTQPTAAAEAAHTHTYTQTVNHVHVQNAASVATGGLVGSTPDASTNTSVASGYSTSNPTGGVATGTTAAGSSHTHTISGGAVDAHAVTQPSQHAAQSHTGASVNTVNSEPAYYALCFIQKS